MMSIYAINTDFLSKARMNRMNIFNGIWLTIVGLGLLLYEYKVLPFGKEKKDSGGKRMKVLGFASLITGILSFVLEC